MASKNTTQQLRELQFKDRKSKVQHTDRTIETVNRLKSLGGTSFAASAVIVTVVDLEGHTLIDGAVAGEYFDNGLRQALLDSFAKTLEMKRDFLRLKLAEIDDTLRMAKTDYSDGE